MLAFDLEDDIDGLPRILLRGTHHYSFLNDIMLHFDCQVVEGERELTLYLKEVSGLPTLSFGVSSEEPIAYVINDVISPSRMWDHTINAEDDHEFWFAPKAVVRNLVEDLMDNPRKVSFIVEPGEEYENTHTFNPSGFSEAAKPVLKACD